MTLVTNNLATLCIGLVQNHMYLQSRCFVLGFPTDVLKFINYFWAPNR